MVADGGCAILIHRLTKRYVARQRDAFYPPFTAHNENLPITMNNPLPFADPALGAWLSAVSAGTLDELDYGVVEMDTVGLVLRYNQTESNFSGLSAEQVVGRHFFRDVAPCSNNRRVAQRYEQSALDETIDYVFSLRMKPTPVTLRMLKLATAPTMYLLVRWT